MFHYTNAGIWTLATIHKLIYLYIRLLTECFLTHITGIWTLATMYKLMFVQVTLVIECYITHIMA